MTDFTLAQWDDPAYTALQAALAQTADLDYRTFHASLVPGIGNFYGVRTPALRTLARQIAKGDAAGFLSLVTDDSYEETLLHGLVVGYAKFSPEEAFARIAAFVPHITNWALCDVCTSSFKVFAQYPETGFALARAFLEQPGEYEKRFGTVVLLDYYIDAAHIDQTLALLCAVRHDGYYVKMAVAWALSVCFVKFRDPTLAMLPALADDFIYNKTLQKCIESYRVCAADKAMLRNMKRKIK